MRVREDPYSGMFYAVADAQIMSVCSAYLQTIEEWLYSEKYIKIATLFLHILLFRLYLRFCFH